LLRYSPPYSSIYHLETFINLWQQHQHRLATVTCVILVVLMMAGLVQTTLFVLDNLDPAATVPERSLAPAQPAKAKDRINLSQLSLFGKAEKRAPSPKVVDAPETKLNLELHGVFTSEDTQNSAAIIGQNNKSDLYQIGDRISGNAVLDAVFEDHILIRRGSRLEKLMFSEASMRAPSPSTINRAPTTPSAAQNQTSTDDRLSQVRQRIQDRRDRRPTESSPGKSLRQFVEDNRETITQDPVQTLSNLGVSPIEEGSAKGYKIDASNPLMTQAGLKSGDVILSVNGKAVGVAMNDTALVDQALRQKRVRVEVQRDSRRFFLTVPIP
jgi:general secretion pathway protein C